MVPGITAAPKDVFSRPGFTFLSATQGVNFAISPLFFVKAEKQRERDKQKNKREREGSYLLPPCFGTIKKEIEIKLLPPHLPFQIFSDREEKGKKKNFPSFVHVFFCVVRKERKTHLVPPLLFLFFSLLSVFGKVPSSNCVHG